MSFYRDRSKPFLSVIESLAQQQKQKKKMMATTEPTSTDDQHADYKTTDEAEKSNNRMKPPPADDETTSVPLPQQKQKHENAVPPAAIHSSLSETTTTNNTSKRESIERNNDDNEEDDAFENDTKHPPSTYLRRFNIKGLDDHYPLTDDQERKEKERRALLESNVACVGTSDDPFRSKLADLVRQRNCLLGHRGILDNNNQGNLTEREELMDQLLTLRESLGVLQQMVNHGVDIHSSVEFKEEGQGQENEEMKSKKNHHLNPSLGKDTAKNDIQGDVIKISLAPLDSNKNVGGASVTISPTKKVTGPSTEEEVKKLRSIGSNPAPYSKFAKNRY